MTRRRAAWTVFIVLAAFTLAAPPVHSAPPVAANGAISADNAVFIPIAQKGCVITFVHPDVHELTGEIAGLMIETGILTLDVCTGEGFFSAEAEFVGTVIGSQPGTAKLRIFGKVTSFVVIHGGHFVLSPGEDGLAGAHASGKWDYIVGVGGTYSGRAHFDEGQ